MLKVTNKITRFKGLSRCLFAEEEFWVTLKAYVDTRNASVKSFGPGPSLVMARKLWYELFLVSFSKKMKFIEAFNRSKKKILKSRLEFFLYIWAEDYC